MLSCIPCTSFKPDGVDLCRRRWLIHGSSTNNTGPRDGCTRQVGMRPIEAALGDRALSSESDLVTHSASSRVRTVLALSATVARDDNATNSYTSSPSSLASPQLPRRCCPSSSSSSLSLSSCRRLQVPACLKTCQRRPCSLVRTTSLCHHWHSSCQPRVMHVVLDTSLVVPRSRTQVSLGHLAVYGHIRFPSVCFPFHLYLSLVAPFF